MQLVASNDNAGSSKTSAVSFAVTAGKTYFIAVDGVGAAQGRFDLAWTVSNKAPANDNFANAQLIEGDDSTTYGTNLLATKETGEPSHAGKVGNTSIWYTWSPSQSGLASFSTAGSTIDTLLAVYTGSNVSSLKTIASNDDSNGSTSSVDFSVSRGVTYEIAVDGFNGAQGDIVLTGNLSANQSTLLWTGNGGDGLWSNPANWNLNRIPGPTDTASISKTGTYTVTLDIDSSVNGLILGDDSSNASSPTLLVGSNRVLTINSGVINFGSTLSLAGGTFHNDSTLEIQGLFDWSGGTWQGDHSYIASKAVLDIHTSATKTLHEEDITNSGLIKWRDNGNIAGENGASILNQKAFEITGDASMTWDGTDKSPNFLNDKGATFTKFKVTTPPTATTHIGWLYGNDGSVSIQAGALNLEGGGVSYGDFDIALNARINVAKNYVFEKYSSHFTGDGFTAIIDGSTGFNIDVSATNFELSQGQLQGTNDLSVSKKFLWSGGNMAQSGSTTIVKNSQMTINGTSSKAIAQRTLVNNGTVNWSAGSIQADSGAKVNNNGDFNCVVGTKFTYRSGAQLEFNNAKGANLTGSTTIAGNVTNLGVIKPLKTTVLAAAGVRTAADINDQGGLINITGDMLQGSGAQIAIVINGTTDPKTKQPLYGQVVVGGAVNLSTNCGLTITAPNYTLKSGDQFEVLRAVSIAGDFSKITYPTLPANLVWSTAKVPETGAMGYMVKVNSKLPTVTSFAPLSGVAGTSVTVSGTNLSNSDGTLPTVAFGAVKVAALSATATQIKVKIPANVKTGPIGITTKGGTGASAKALVILPVITSFVPTSGAAGASIVITGTNLTNTTTPKPAIKFNQTLLAPTDFVSASATQVKIKVPAAATTGKISLVTSDGTAFSSTSFTFLAPPVITTAPVSGAVGATITISGKNFVNGTTLKPTVKIGALTIPIASVTVATATQIKLVVPAQAKTGKISVITSGGTASSVSDFVVGAAPAK